MLFSNVYGGYHHDFYSSEKKADVLSGEYDKREKKTEKK